jgi:hypothetical protein
MAELRRYEPTWRDRLAQVMMGDGRASPERRRVVEGLLGSSGLGNTGMGVVDVTPVGGILQAQEAAQQGDYRGAAMNAMFLGAGARTANQAALKTAKDMAAKGAGRDAIWNETGWFKGVDDKWRFEIPDNKSFYRSLPTPSPQSQDDFVKQGGDTVGRQLIHDELFAAYPDAKGIGLQQFSGNSKLKGTYSSGEGGAMDGGQISLMGNDKGSTILHELQHAIQDAEGFARGGNAFGLKPGTPAWGIYQDRLKSIVTPPSLEDFAKSWGGTPAEAAADYAKHVKQLETYSKKGLPSDLDRAAQESAVEEAYRRMAGEVESRNVESRLSMTPEQRRATPPWMTQDVEDELQIIRGLLDR